MKVTKPRQYRGKAYRLSTDAVISLAKNAAIEALLAHLKQQLAQEQGRAAEAKRERVAGRVRATMEERWVWVWGTRDCQEGGE
jgi:hypothetical protein